MYELIVWACILETWEDRVSLQAKNWVIPLGDLGIPRMWKKTRFCPEPDAPLGIKDVPLGDAGHHNIMSGMSVVVQTPQTHAYNFLNLGNTKQPSQTVHKSMNSRHSRLSHGSSPKLVQLSRLSWIMSPEQAWNSGFTTSSRLGGLFSPERDLGSLKHTQLLAWMRIRAQHAQFSSRPRLGEPSSPERENLSLNTNTGHLSEKHEPKPGTRFYNSRLGERDTPGWNLQSFVSVHAHNSPRPCQKYSLTIPSQSISNNQTIWTCFTSI